ncbi:glycoside hydrolase family 15 protein [Subtercola sp. PAMC28395]|uniref:glycoside hydrolase family 15 protein n=1 Tax=Subtercola sp. PAMC28395 TaxID=2846775 RepID=UPI001C0AC3E2|nr:glycoside hydrolase family 15 protein [Subtercola sp. PAMC28395]QWT23831.1 glycoside hydrolase family 15 protein [Subtercola sp. PAMC28395]
MSLPIEDYALISDCHTAALVGRDGSIDWLCLPRYDSPSTFGALLGDESHGRWMIAPTDPSAHSRREYLGNTFILVTTWTTPTGVVEVTDFMPHGDRRADLVRRVKGVSGSVEMTVDLRIRFAYATAIPWVRQVEEPIVDGTGFGVGAGSGAGSGAGTDSSTGTSGRSGPRTTRSLLAVAGPDAVLFRGAELSPKGHSHRREYTVREGELVDMVMTWYPSHRSMPQPVDVDKVLAETAAWWEKWGSNSTSSGAYSSAVVRSLLVLRALTHEDTGGIVAAATTSLPEAFGGERNWDYRYVWLRDASLTLMVLLDHGFIEEASDWRQWLLRAIAGDPADVQIMYGLQGERYLPEHTIPSLPGYQGASPVRVGNGAVSQYQADVIGEVMVGLHQSRVHTVRETKEAWALQRALLGFVEANLDRADSGIWEIRGANQFFTHSRVMIWAALDRGVRGVEEFGLRGPVEMWRSLREQVRSEIESHGVDPATGAYTQVFGGTEVDASLLQLAQVEYCAYDDPRMLATVAVIEKTLLRDGLLMRYRTETGVDGLPAGEHPFLACSFWLVEQYARSGRVDDATALMERLLALRNDVGLLSEEYDVTGHRQAGNTPQALSHLALVRAADALTWATRTHAG